jgi:hypothetical protein
MRTLVIGAALAALIASPAFAQSYAPLYGSGNVVFPPGASYEGTPLVGTRATDSAGPYAYEPQHAPEHTAQVRRLHVRHHVKQVQRGDTQN